MTALVSQNPSVLSIFTFDNLAVRTVIIDNTVWFVASEISEILGYSQTQNALYHCKYATTSLRDTLDYHDVNKTNNLHPSTKWIPEYDVYSLIFRSKKPEAEKFRVLVTEEIIPNLRRHGFYGDPALLQKLQEEALFYKHKINYLSPEKVHTSTYIGDKLRMSNQKFLSLTKDIGLTIKDRRSYGNAWRLTKSGSIYGKYSGAYIKWSERVLIPSYKHLGMDESFFTEAIPYIESRQTSLTA